MRTLVAPLLLLSAACGASTFELPPTTATTLRGEPALSVRGLTDMETVQGVASVAGQTYVAASDGLWIHEADSTPRRVEWSKGQNLVGVAVQNGEGFAATARAVFALDGSAQSLPEIGEIVDLRATSDYFWAGGTRGLARRAGGGEWELFGDSGQVTGLFGGSGNVLWVGTARGLWRIEGDVVEEHAEGRGLAAGYVRSAVALGGARVFALVQNADYSFLSYYDENRWTNYTLDGFDQVVVGLGLLGSDVALYTRTHAIRIADASQASGVGLVALDRGERLQSLTYDGAGGVPARTNAPLVDPRRPSPLAAVPAGQPSVDAPGWAVSPIAKVSEAAYRVFHQADRTFVADYHRGLTVIGRTGIEGRLATNTLVAERDLRIESDERARTWILTDDHVLGVWARDHFDTVAVPEGLRPDSMSAAPRGLYVACLDQSAPGTVVVIRREGDAWVRVDARALVLPSAGGPLSSAHTPSSPANPPAAPEAVPSANPDADPSAAPSTPAAPEAVVAVPFLGVRDDEEIWIGVRVGRMGPQNRSASRMRGVAVYGPAAPAVVYHHANATPETDGEGALRMPDDFGNMDLNEEGMAWFSTLVGAVRIGNFQSVTFGEARGVRGEVVSDVLVGTSAKIWLAAAEGPGYYFRQQFEFRMPANVIAARPMALALASDGAIWGAGPHGLIRYQNDQWTVFGAEDGIEDSQYVDIEADAAGQMWVLGESGLWLLSR